MKYQFIRLATLIFAILLFLVGCSPTFSSSRPTEGEVEDAVKVCLRREDNELFSRHSTFDVGHLMIGRIDKITTVEVVEWASSTEKNEYKLAKIRVAGSAEAVLEKTRGDLFAHEDRKFNTVAEFRFQKDNYGKWQASLTHKGTL